ncbi:HAD family hydrolase [Micromonospora sp. NPDC050397]|uniref:HAD family hydrolase n=1 Tax=Micromonospora sp. NPDC050397 TaxID=3364279 RepID=UPI0038516F35
MNTLRNAVAVDAVVFDLGGVLARPSDPTGKVASVLGPDVDDAAFADAYWAHRTAYDLGWPEAEYWTAVAHEAGVRLPSGAVQTLTSVDAIEWTVLAPDALRLVEDLHRQGGRLVLLSNAPHALADEADRSTWSKLFERLIFSAREGLAKPDPAAYARATELLDLPPARIAFFDDRLDNVEAARRHGWSGHLWEGVEAARSVLAGTTLTAGGAVAGTRAGPAPNGTGPASRRTVN